jgi:hypothetical protein
LSLSREIVSTYGGRIWASNRKAEPGAPGHAQEDQAGLNDQRVDGVAGARFIVRLPAAGAAPSRGAQLLGRRN